MNTEYPEKYTTLGLKIAYYRKKAGYTQESFAERIKYSFRFTPSQMKSTLHRSTCFYAGCLP